MFSQTQEVPLQICFQEVEVEVFQCRHKIKEVEINHHSHLNLPILPPSRPCRLPNLLSRLPNLLSRLPNLLSRLPNLLSRLPNPHSPVNPTSHPLPFQLVTQLDSPLQLAIIRELLPPAVMPHPLPLPQVPCTVLVSPAIPPLEGFTREIPQPSKCTPVKDQELSTLRHRDQGAGHLPPSEVDIQATSKATNNYLCLLTGNRLLAEYFELIV